MTPIETVWQIYPEMGQKVTLDRLYLLVSVLRYQEVYLPRLYYVMGECSQIHLPQKQ